MLNPNLVATEWQPAAPPIEPADASSTAQTLPCRIDSAFRPDQVSNGKAQTPPGHLFIVVNQLVTFCADYFHILHVLLHQSHPGFTADIFFSPPAIVEIVPKAHTVFSS